MTDTFTKGMLIKLSDVAAADPAEKTREVLREAANATGALMSHFDIVHGKIETAQRKVELWPRKSKEAIEFLRLAEKLLTLYDEMKTKSGLRAIEPLMTAIYTSLLKSDSPFLDELLGNKEERRKDFDLLVITYPQAFRRQRDLLVRYMASPLNNHAYPPKFRKYWNEHYTKVQTVEGWAGLFEQLMFILRGVPV